jgi:hypothetical protein
MHDWQGGTQPHVQWPGERSLQDFCQSIKSEESLVSRANIMFVQEAGSTRLAARLQRLGLGTMRVRQPHIPPDLRPYLSNWVVT